MKINYKKMLPLLGCISVMACVSPTAKAQSLALDLSATGNNVQISSYTMDLSSGNAVTIQMDVKLHNLAQLHGMACMSNGNTAEPLVSYFWNGDGKFHTERGDGASATAATSPNGLFVANNWYNLAMVLKTDTVFTYLDGALISINISTGNPSFNAAFMDNLFIGDRENGGVNADAEIDNFRIWTVEKSQEEIDSLRNTCIDGSDPNLSVLYTFEEGAGTTVFDLATTDGSQDGTITGTVAWTSGTLGSTRSTIYPTLCAGASYTAPSGAMYTTNGQYMDTIANAHNCDSIITINLLELPAINQQTFAPNSYTFCGADTVTPKLNSSNIGTNYTLQDNNYATLQGPIAGNGGALTFNQLVANQTTSYHVMAEKTFVDTAYNAAGTSYAQSGNTLSLTQDFTYEAWIKSPSQNPAWNGIVATSMTGGTGGYVQFNFNGSGKLRTEISGGIGVNFDGNRIVEDGNWHFVVLTNDQDTAKLYVDGQLDAFYKWPSALSLSSDRNINIASQRYDGVATNTTIDNLSIWGETRTAAEVMADMNTHFAGSETNLLAYYTFENMTPTSIMDMTGSHPATIQSGMANKVGGLRSTTTCDIEMMDSISVTINTVDATATNASPTLTANATGAAYQWIDCNNGNAAITGANSQSYTATADGNYAVVVTQNGCSDTSACMSVGNVGIQKYALNNFSVYPNPNKGTFTIALDNNYSQANVQVLDVVGKSVLSTTLNHQTNTIDMSKSPKGMYFVVLNTGVGASQITKVVVE